MSLKIKIAARLKAKAAGVNLSQKRIDAIVARAEKGLTDESDDAAIDANLTAIDELTPFKEIAALDDHQRAKEKKDAADKEAARLKAIEEGKTPPPEVDPNETATDKALRLIMEKLEKQDAVIASFGKEKVTNTRREQYAKALEGTSDAFKAKALKDFDRMNFKDDDDFNGYLTDATEDAKSFIQEDANNGLGGDRPVGGAGGDTKKAEASQAEIDAVFPNFKL
jgi:hypothetical protein